MTTWYFHHDLFLFKKKIHFGHFPKTIITLLKGQRLLANIKLQVLYTQIIYYFIILVNQRAQVTFISFCLILQCKEGNFQS